MMYSPAHKKQVATSFLAFSRLAHDQKMKTLNASGILLDTDKEKECLVELYFMQGFFVEKIVCKDSAVELIPFKNGYRIHHFLN